ncbi:hypothetical protein [Denitromonas iodatirespirans]|uniref:Uncharacterized protein n=2 Tax=Rhodocyclales TaxID=206389 RepID=A0A944H8S0_DENI1|nr:hypothetical protein [Denitromonas iodatirespirans]MBT0961675.1 hypothetical protein [Denitromonas iodatirespirans]
MAKLLMPEHIKLIGTNLCSDVTYSGVGEAGWRLMWGANWDWDGWVKPQIDLMIGNGVGCNAVRVQGAAYAVQNGTIAMSDYLARWSQVIEYCRDRGVYVYPCGCTIDLDTNFTLPIATIGAVFAEIFRHHQQYDNVIGIDIIQETTNTDTDGWTAMKPRMASLIADIKSRGVTLPLTFSSSEFLDSGYPRLLEVAHLFDYIDLHPYYRAANIYDLDSLLAAYPDKDIIMAESGAEVSWTTRDNQLTQIRRMLDLARIGHPRMRGLFVWSSTDPADPNILAGKAWGQYDWDHIPRHDRLNLIRRYTGGSVSRANRVR